MIRTLMIGLTTAVAAIIISTTGAQGAEPDIKRQEVKPQTQAFLMKTAEEQQAQIALGQPAATQAKNARVTEFGEETVAAHKKLSRELEELAAHRGLKLPSDLANDDKRTRKELSHTTRHAFDRTYLQYILRDHQNYLNEFEEGVGTVEDAEVLQWAHKTLPVLRAHVEKARWTQMVLHTVD